MVDTLVIPLLKIIIVLNATLVGVTYMVLLERKVIAWAQSRLGPQEKTVAELVGRDAHAARREPVHRVGLVVGASHQRGEGPLHALSRIPFEDVAVERIEGEEVLIVLARWADLRK